MLHWFGTYFYVTDIYCFKLIFIFHLKHETVDGYRRYFTQIVGYVSNMAISIILILCYVSELMISYLGFNFFLTHVILVITVLRFFVVEDHILHVTQGLVTRAYTDELWNMALSKIIAVLRAHSVSQTIYVTKFLIQLLLELLKCIMSEGNYTSISSAVFFGNCSDLEVVMTGLCLSGNIATEWGFWRHF